MKSKKTIISLALVIALLVLGVGYAALSQTLTINGTAEIAPDEFDVHFDDSATAATHVTELEFDTAKTTATITVELDRDSYDSVTQQLTVVNDSPELYANFASSDLYTITYDDDADDYITVSATNPTSSKLAPTETATLDLTVALNADAPEIEDETKTVTFTVTFDATSSVS